MELVLLVIVLMLVFSIVNIPAETKRVIDVVLAIIVIIIIFHVVFGTGGPYIFIRR